MAGKKKYAIGFNGRKFIVKDYSVCKSFFSKARGLMFRSKNYRKPLLFIFDKPGIYPIHSFFCRDFVAVWMLNEKVVDKKFVKPWKFSVTPKAKFNKLLEIPVEY